MWQNFPQDGTVTDHPALDEVGEMKVWGGGSGGVEFRTLNFKYSHQQITGGTERAIQQELQK